MVRLAGGQSDAALDAAWEDYANDVPPDAPPTDEEMERMYEDWKRSQLTFPESTR